MVIFLNRNKYITNIFATMLYSICILLNMVLITHSREKDIDDIAARCKKVEDAYFKAFPSPYKGIGVYGLVNSIAYSPGGLIFNSEYALANYTMIHYHKCVVIAWLVNEELIPLWQSGNMSTKQVVTSSKAMRLVPTGINVYKNAPDTGWLLSGIVPIISDGEYYVLLAEVTNDSIAKSDSYPHIKYLNDFTDAKWDVIQKNHMKKFFSIYVTYVLYDSYQSSVGADVPIRITDKNAQLLFLALLLGMLISIFLLIRNKARP